MNRKKILLAASAVVLAIGGVFAEKAIKRATATDLYVATGTGAIPGPGCAKLATATGTLTINALFTTTAGANQAAIRSTGGTLRLVYQNSLCTQPVYFQ